MDQQKSKQLPELLEKYHNGLLSEQEQALLDEWFEELGKNEISNTLSEEDKIELKNSLLEFIKKKSAAEVIAISWRGKPVRPLADYFRAWKIAASILLLATCSYFLWQFYGSEILGSGLFSGAEVTSVSTAGQINKVLLSDGSIIWLKNNSTLTYPNRFSGKNRQVILQGEALFEITKDPDHPFIIQCGELTTTVLGTSFNIKASEENIEVVVLTGKVSLTSATDKQGIIVLPEEKAVYRKELKQLAKVEPAMEEPVAIVSGTEYDMNFNDTRMTEIIRRIEGKFNVKVAMSDPKLGNCVITADFTDQSLKKTLNIITTALAVQYEIDDDEIILTGKGCN